MFGRGQDVSRPRRRMGPVRLFHGTKEHNLKSIQARGLVPRSGSNWEDWWWSREIGLPPSVFLANKPKAGYGSSPVGFAARGPGDGYILVVDMPAAELREAMRGIWTTHDIDMYYDTHDQIYYQRFRGYGELGPEADPGAVLAWMKQNDPGTAERLCIVAGQLKPNPQWFLDRRRSAFCNDSQVVTGPVPASYIRAAVKVYDGRAERVLPEFDPKHQTKLKHKHKTFASLFLHHLKRVG